MADVLAWRWRIGPESVPSLAAFDEGEAEEEWDDEEWEEDDEDWEDDWDEDEDWEDDDWEEEWEDEADEDEVDLGRRPRRSDWD